MKYIIFLPIMSVLFAACIKEECKINGGQYEFEIPVTLSPASDTFQIGDTITVVSEFTEDVYERETDKTYSLKKFQFFPSTEIVKIDSTASISGIYDYFELIIDNTFNYSYQEFSTGVQALVGEYNYVDGSYYLKFKIKAKSSGLFYMEQGVSPNIASHQDFDGKCSNLEVDGAVVLNGGSDNNIHMLSDSPDPHYNDWILQKPEERFHKFGGYCFYVRE